MNTGSSISFKMLVPLSNSSLDITFSLYTTFLFGNGDMMNFYLTLSRKILTPDTGQSPNYLVGI